jgi:hypothetical protein
VFKKIDHQSIAFKLSLIILFSALFFVQLQLKFIEYAYNDFSTAKHSANLINHAFKKHQLDKTGSDSGTAYIKLNKRYPVYNAFTLHAAPLIIKPVFSPVFLQFFYRTSFIADNPYPVFFLRGPPTKPLHSSL